MSIRQLTLAFTASLLLPLCLFGQSEYTKAAIEAFKNIDQSGVNTGILYDRVFPFANLNTFGANDQSDYGHFRQAFTDLYWASFSQNRRLKPDDFIMLAEKGQRDGVFPVGVINAKYQTVNYDAIENDGTGHYRVKSGWSGPLYQLKQANVVSVLASTVYDGVMPVRLPRWAILSLNEASVTQVQIQVAGYTRTLTPDGPVQYLYFDNSGTFTAQYTVSLSDGSTFTAKSSVRAELPPGYQASSAAATSVDPIYTASFPRQDDISYIDSVRITADVPFQGYDEPSATLGKGDVLYFYGQGRRQVVRPVIILDGFDPRDKRSAHYGLYNRKLSYGTSNLGNQLRLGNPSDGFGDKHDVIILNFPFYQTFDTNCRMEEICVRRQFGQTKDDVQCLESQMVQVCDQRDGGADYVERNAMVLVKLIQMVNQQLQANGSSEKITLIGPSMSGLITRYALRYMEQNNLNHNCKLWVSFDSPHHGANIPIGLQHFLDFQVNGMGNQGARSNLNDLSTPAAKQMLLHHYTFYKNAPAGADREQAEGSPGFRARFVQKMNEIGFPQAACLRKVALNNGSRNGIS